MRTNYYKNQGTIYLSGTGKKYRVITHGEGLGDIYRWASRGMKRLMGNETLKKIGNTLLNQAKQTGEVFLEEAKTQGKRALRESGKQLADIAVSSANTLLDDIAEGKNVERSIRTNVRKTKERVGEKVKELSKKEQQIAKRRAREILESERRRLTSEAKRLIKEEQEDSSIFDDGLSVNDLYGEGLTRIGMNTRGKGLRQVGTGKKRGRPRKKK